MWKHACPYPWQAAQDVGRVSFYNAESDGAVTVSFCAYVSHVNRSNWEDGAHNLTHALTHTGVQACKKSLTRTSRLDKPPHLATHSHLDKPPHLATHTHLDKPPHLAGHTHIWTNNPIWNSYTNADSVVPYPIPLPHVPLSAPSPSIPWTPSDLRVRRPGVNMGLEFQPFPCCSWMSCHMP